MIMAALVTSFITVVPLLIRISNGERFQLISACIIMAGDAVDDYG